MNRTLLCTFAHVRNLQLVTHYIKQNYNPTKLFVFCDVDNPAKLFVTYNTDIVSTETVDTILIHRRPETSTLYTINALNRLIEKINNGVLDKQYPIEWELYRNSIILTAGDSVHITKLKLYRII